MLKPADRNHIDRRVIHLAPESEPTGRVLISYIIESFTVDPEDPIFRSHTHYWETRQMVTTFLQLGFAVDLISYRNTHFIPEVDYNFLVGARTNFVRLSSLLNKSCKKIVHLDTAHWVSNNYNAYRRLHALTDRKHAAPLQSIRLIERNQAIEYADLATILGNQFTIDSYAYAGKPIHRIPISSAMQFDWEDRDIDAIRKNYLWFGSAGFVHKGLDLVLELFAGMPDYQLYVCGPLDKEQEFVDLYYPELYETDNIHAIGWVDVHGKQFRELLNSCLGIVYPTCSEGGGGSAIDCMHAGVIPIVSYEASIDVEGCGLLLKDDSLLELKTKVIQLSSLPLSELEKLSHAAWQYASSTHSRDIFAKKYRDFVQEVLL